MNLLKSLICGMSAVGPGVEAGANIRPRMKSCKARALGLRNIRCLMAGFL